jgi:heme o synthase
MKASAPTLIPAAATDKGWVAVLSELVKARLTTLVLATTAVGFQMGLVGRNDWNLLLRTLLGTGCVAAAAAVLNQWMERDADARMLRTQDRPLPSGRIHPGTALVGGLVGALLGSVYLWFAVHPLTATLGLLTLLIYLLVYTPLKRITPWNTVVGAIPGALPPLMGWTAARGSLAIEGWSLFALLACWQLPHFLAIAWMFRDDYARGGFAMLPLHDPTGRRTSTQAVGHTVALIGVSLLPHRARPHQPTLPRGRARSRRPVPRLCPPLPARRQPRLRKTPVLGLDPLPASPPRPHARHPNELIAAARSPHRSQPGTAGAKLLRTRGRKWGCY